MPDNEQDRQSLRNLEGVRVYVADLTPEALAQRISREDLQRAIESRLRDARIRVLTQGDAPAGDPYLRVTVSVSAERQRLIAYHLVIDFVQFAFLRRNPEFVHNRAQTWKASNQVGLVPVGEFARALRQDLNRQVDEFIAAYQAMNQPR